MKPTEENFKRIGREGKKRIDKGLEKAKERLRNPEYRKRYNLTAGEEKLLLDYLEKH